MIKERWSDSSGSYIRIEGDTGDRICDGILMSGCVRSILPVSIERVNGKREYVYDVTGYRSLTEYMDDVPASEDKLRKTMLGIMSAISELEEYLLGGEHLVLNEDLVFIKNDGSGIRGIYIAEKDVDITGAINLLAEKLMKHQMRDDVAADFLYRLHSLTADKSMTRDDIMGFLTEAAVAEEIHEKGEGSTAKEAVGMRSGLGKGREKGVERITGKRNGKIHKDKGSSGQEYPDKNEYILPVILLGAGIVIPTVMTVLGCFTRLVSGKVDIAMMAAAYLFFVAVAGYGAWRLWPRRIKPIQHECEEGITLCLMPTEVGRRTLPVAYFPWSIGADEKKANGIISDNDMDGVHARFTREGKSVFLTDEESGSGTYINDKKLIPWQAGRLKDGDRVRFGVHSYVVELLDI
ncbi:MAG: FHA domain-containing protein [Lachnospiraceae bacterium]|nr:FHA domain-containing protein [Lachnospiraceae bacterium]